MFDTETARWIALVTFIAGYALFLAFERCRHYTALSIALLIVALGLYSPREAFLAVNWKIVIIFFTTLAAAEVFMLSGAAACAAEAIIARCRSATAAVIVLCSLTGVLSLFVENVACVLIAAPIAINLARRLDFPPQPILVGCALVSNVQGCGLLVGDPPSMLLASHVRMSFMDFIWYQGRPSLFFAVQAGALAGLVYLAFVFGRRKGSASIERSARLVGIWPSPSLVGLIASLAIATRIENGIGWLAPAGCLFFSAASVAWLYLATRGRRAPDEGVEEALFEHELPSVSGYLKSLDWKTTLFIAAVFVPVGALSALGWIDSLADVILRASGGSVCGTFALLVVTAVAASAFVDNVPFLLIMLPAVTRLGEGLGIVGAPTVLYFGLLLGASVGGNVTPIGAQANIAAVGLLRRHGYPVRLRDYMALSVPYTIVAVAASCAFAYFVYHPR